jgi:hypothetical protein
MSKNIFSIKTYQYPKGRRRDVDGPWKPTVQEAIDAYAEMLVKKELHTFLICQPFVAERTDKATAPAGDSKGNYYKTNEEETKTLATKLAQRGLHL